MKCRNCGHWNSIEVEKVMLNPECNEPKIANFSLCCLTAKQ